MRWLQSISLVCTLVSLAYNGWFGVQVGINRFGFGLPSIQAPLPVVDVDKVTHNVQKVDLATVTVTMEPITSSSVVLAATSAATIPHWMLKPCQNNPLAIWGPLPSLFAAPDSSLDLWLTEPKFSILEYFVYISLSLVGIYLQALLICLILHYFRDRNTACPLIVTTLVVRSRQMVTNFWSVICLIMYTLWLAFRMAGTLVFKGLWPVLVGFQLVITKAIARIPRRAEDFVDMVLDADERSWKAVLVGARSAFGIALLVLSTSFAWVQSFIILMYHQRVLTKEKAEFMENVCIQETRDAYAWAFAASYGEIVRTYMENIATQERYKILQEELANYKMDNPDDGLRELGQKAVSYRLSHVELVKDCNWYRMCIANILNWNLNTANNVNPDSNEAATPYCPSTLCFTAEPNPTTGLHYDLNINTLSHAPFSHELIKSTEKFMYNKKNNTFSVTRGTRTFTRPGIPDSHIMPSRTDPFASNGALIKAMFPGIELAYYTKTSDPMQLANKRPLPIAKPEFQFGRQIEDAAVTGSLAAWNEYNKLHRNMGPRYNYAANSGVPRFANRPAAMGAKKLQPTLKMENGVSSSLLPSTPLHRGYAAPYVEDGSPMRTSPIVW